MVKISTVPSKVINAYWEKNDYKSVFDSCSQNLLKYPENMVDLLFSGYSAFHIGLSELNEAQRQKWIDISIIRLRKAMAINPSISGIPEYILGKAYYHKGWYFYDSCAYYLEKAELSGYNAADIDEYLAVVFAALGDTEKSINRFEKAMAKSNSELLMLAASKAFQKFNNSERAEFLAQNAKNKTSDVLVKEKACFILIDIYRTKKDYSKAEKELENVLLENPNSSEAHYQLGLIFSDQNDFIRARAEWRKALFLDPGHAAARQKLSE